MEWILSGAKTGIEMTLTGIGVLLGLYASAWLLTGAIYLAFRIADHIMRR